MSDMLKKLNITLIDYGFGNLFSLKNALEYLGAGVTIAQKPSEIGQNDGLIIPGVGAFGDGMNGLKKRKFIKPILEHAKFGTKILGICLGMQFLFDYSEEFGKHQGLSLIPGNVKKIPEPRDGEYKIPHIGWAPLMAKKNKNHLLSGMKNGSPAYFVHSYVAYPKDKKNIIGSISLGKNLLAAAVQKDNIMGVQFHPEKSGEVGLKILKNFLEI